MTPEELNEKMQQLKSAATKEDLSKQDPQKTLAQIQNIIALNVAQNLEGLLLAFFNEDGMVMYTLMAAAALMIIRVDDATDDEVHLEKAVKILSGLVQSFKDAREETAK